jgi:hypothetical protein
MPFKPVLNSDSVLQVTQRFIAKVTQMSYFRRFEEMSERVHPSTQHSNPRSLGILKQLHFFENEIKFSTYFLIRQYPSVRLLYSFIYT